MKAALIALTMILTAAPAMAQDAAEPAAQAQPASWNGLPATEISARLMALGLEVSPPQAEGDRLYLRVTDGPVRWVATLFSCREGACPDLQLTAAFSGPQATRDVVDLWNSERRFVKAFYAAPETGTEGTAVAQYDILLVPTVGADQLDDPIQVWRSLIADLGRTVTPPPAQAGQ